LDFIPLVMQRKEIDGHPFILHKQELLSDKESQQRIEAFYKQLSERRSVREFSEEPIPKQIIEKAILAASSAPSGAHRQPWTFCVVSDPEMKMKIRKAAEEEEYKAYHGRMNEEWLEAIKPMGTDWNKPFLETAPYLIIVFKKVNNVDAEGKKLNNYYVNESVGMACGFLLAALNEAGLQTLTHTPSPMNFLAEILQRPENERPYLLIPVGKPVESTWVPDIKRRSLEEVAVFYE